MLLPLSLDFTDEILTFWIDNEVILLGALNATNPVDGLFHVFGPPPCEVLVLAFDAEIKNTTSASKNVFDPIKTIGFRNHGDYF